MITLTTEIRSRRFKEFEKERLYKKLREPYREKEEEWRKNFTEFLDREVVRKVLDPDLLELGEKPYCTKSTSRFTLEPDVFELDEYYIGNPNEKHCKIGLKFDYLSKTCSCAVDSKNYSISLSSLIKEKCPPEVVEQVKYFMYEYAKSQYECTYFGLGTFVKPHHYGYSMYGLFPELTTWGNLYNKSPEYFEILYQMKEGKTLEESKEMLDPEKKLLVDLKTTLGY